MVQKCSFNRQPRRWNDLFHALLPWNIFILFYFEPFFSVFCKTVTQKTRKLQNDETFSLDLFLSAAKQNWYICIIGTLREMIIMHSFRARLEKDIHNLTIKRPDAITNLREKTR